MDCDRCGAEISTGTAGMGFPLGLVGLVWVDWLGSFSFCKLRMKLAEGVSISNEFGNGNAILESKVPVCFEAFLRTLCFWIFTRAFLDG